MKQLLLGGGKIFIHVCKRLLNAPSAIYRRLYYLWDSNHFVKFGRGSFLSRPYICVSGKRNIQIGDRVYIGKHTRIEAITRYNDKHYFPTLIIGDDVVINQNFHCTCAERLVIGEGTSITANCGVFDIVHPYGDASLNPRMADIETKPVEIGNHCLIGMNSVLLPGTNIGEHCVIGANSTLSGFYPSYSIIVGSPAKIVKRYCFETQSWRKTDAVGNFID